jgi:pyridoxine 4-dehydrogenase
MTTINAAESGTFKIGGTLEVVRLGFGAMRVTGNGIWGDPKDPVEARRTLKRVPELGINFIDTADSYGPFVSEDLLAETLHPYPAGMVVATKGANTRPGPNQWVAVGRREYLQQCLEMSLRRLKLDRIDLWQLHRIDPKVPAQEQFETMKAFQDSGKVLHLGLSEVSVAEIEAARAVFAVATVQNRYNLADREHEAVLDYCEQNSIGFIPWFPLATGSLAKPGGKLDAIAQRLGATPSQVALAWLLKRSPVMLPIPGTGSVEHLEENTAAADLKLSDDDFQELSDLHA